MDGVAMPMMETGDIGSASLEFLMPVTSVLDECGKVEDGAQKDVLQPMARLISAAGF